MAMLPTKSCTTKTFEYLHFGDLYETTLVEWPPKNFRTTKTDVTPSIPICFQKKNRGGPPLRLPTSGRRVMPPFFFKYEMTFLRSFVVVPRASNRFQVQLKANHLFSVSLADFRCQSTNHLPNPLYIFLFVSV